MRGAGRGHDIVAATGCLLAPSDWTPIDKWECRVDLVDNEHEDLVSSCRPQMRYCRDSEQFLANQKGPSWMKVPIHAGRRT
uniref:Uncharacterized protein n=1 Tax=Oryza meridionalis TaxID=40149 RepID=A0A0E0CZ60_9ORYZ